ncbi:F-box protein [Salix suchowensis]|nr:F-box protein [Salix suchowensis]
MALGKNCSSMKANRISGDALVSGEEEGLGLKIVRSYSFGRKRVLSLNNILTMKSIRVLCGVDHDDLKQLFHVSKVIREATSIAKEWHFAYSTPRKTQAFRTPIDFGNPSELDEIEAPNAPKQRRSYKSQINRKRFADLSVALFASPKKGLFMETEI